MKKSKKLIVRAIAAVLIVLLLLSFLSPELAVRRYILFKLHPVTSVTAQITDLHKYDAEYGHLYEVKGYVDRATGDSLEVFYLKQTGFIWYVFSVGTAP